jgi:hypothetical protein
MIENVQNNLRKTITEISEKNLAIDLYGRQWHDTKNKINSLLLAGKKDVNKVKTDCDALYNLDVEQRGQFVSDNFGPKYLERIAPLLQQLATIEDAYNK